MKLKSKIIATALLGILFASVASAQNYSIEVGTDSIVIIPKEAPSRSETTVWSNGLTVAQGDYIANTNTRVRTYWAITAGTSTNMPTHAFGTATAGDTIEWLYLPNRRGVRKNSIIFRDINTTTYYTKDEVAATIECAPLDATLPARSFGNHSADVKAIVEAGTAIIPVELDY